MRTMHQWLDEYGASHRNATNEFLHWICVPVIALTVVGFLWSIPVPDSFAQVSRWLNWATIGVALWIGYYFLLSPSLGIGATLCLIAMLFIVRWMDSLPWPLWATCLAVFVVAWIGQFIGHSIEGTRPSFFKDVQFLLIGPIWLVSHVYRRLGVSF
jgi:uncharacterized membrane protein YGL010W